MMVLSKRKFLGMIGKRGLKRIGICVVGVAFILLNASNVLASTSSIVVDANTGEVLSSKDPDKLRYPASLTKLMTLYITFEALDKGLIRLDDEFPVSRTAANRSPSRLGLKPGTKISVQTAIDALIVKSANDCATVLAEGLGYSEAEFALKMTEIAEALGMKNTTFKNASGLPNRAQQSTARDMVILGAAIYHHFPQYYPLFSNASFEYDGKTYYTHNNILKTFDGADGLKTGYIAASGYNIVTSAARGGNRVIAVTMGHKSQEQRDKDVANMMEKGFQKLALNNSQKPATLYAKMENPRSFRIKPIKPKPIDNPKPNETPNKLQSDDEIKLNNTQSELWAVQVGAFSNYAKARSYAISLKEKISELQDKEIDIEPAQTAYAIVYRSKLINLSKEDAEKICIDLKQSKKSCIVVSMKDENPLILAYK